MQNMQHFEKREYSCTAANWLFQPVRPSPQRITANGFVRNYKEWNSALLLSGSSLFPSYIFENFLITYFKFGSVSRSINNFRFKINLINEKKLK